MRLRSVTTRHLRIAAGLSAMIWTVALLACEPSPASPPAEERRNDLIEFVNLFLAATDDLWRNVGAVDSDKQQNTVWVGQALSHFRDYRERVIELDSPAEPPAIAAIKAEALDEAEALILHFEKLQSALGGGLPPPADDGLSLPLLHDSGSARLLIAALDDFSIGHRNLSLSFLDHNEEASLFRRQ